jgi:ATP-dependent Clp protease ATP-binding subunit ClpC
MVLKSDDFTEQAQEVLARSQQIVQRFQHSQWDAEHVLLALLEQENGVPVQILFDLGVAVDGMRRRTEAALEGQPKVAYGGGQIYQTP